MQNDNSEDLDMNNIPIDEKISESISESYFNILKALGEDTDREGLEKTPMRVAKSLQYLTQGRKLDPAAILKSALFKQDHQHMVVIKDIEMYSMCEHHILPFFGKEFFENLAFFSHVPHSKVFFLDGKWSKMTF